MEPIEKFYNILFEPHEYVCWSYDIYGTKVYGQQTMLQQRGANFFSINPLIGGRLDANVTCFRNILIEFDSIPLREQIIELTLKVVPYSTLVYSGGKSYHAIISLEEPCETREDYDRLVLRIQKKLPDMDTSTKNPSRFSRAPGALRNGVEQTLHGAHKRCSKKDLEEWLGPEEIVEKPIKLKTEQSYRILRGPTQYFLGFGAPDGTWNRELFLATLDMARASYTRDEIIERLEAITGHLDKKDMSTIKSAMKIAESEKV